MKLKQNPPRLFFSHSISRNYSWYFIILSYLYLVECSDDKCIPSWLHELSWIIVIICIVQRIESWDRLHHITNLIGQQFYFRFSLCNFVVLFWLFNTMSGIVLIYCICLSRNAFFKRWIPLTEIDIYGKAPFQPNNFIPFWYWYVDGFETQHHQLLLYIDKHNCVLFYITNQNNTWIYSNFTSVVPCVSFNIYFSIFSISLGKQFSNQSFCYSLVICWLDVVFVWVEEFVSLSLIIFHIPPSSTNL